MSGEYPPEVQALHTALERLPGIFDLSSSLSRLEGLAVGDLASLKAGHLPHATIRRTEGGLRGEALVQTQFRLRPEAASWRTLEFLAWFVRDEARGGEYLQLRPFALSPSVDGISRLGETLGFHLELFCEDVGDDTGASLQQVKHIADELQTAIDMYREALEQR